MERAEKRGLDSRIVLCELRPVVAVDPVGAR
jgi:hypothetical protein